MKGKADRNIRRLVSGLWTVFEICCRQNMKMNVLVINCGSSSLKYQLINSDSEAVLAKGLCERIGIDGRLVYQKTGCDKEITEAAMPTHKEAIQMVLDALTNDKTGAIGSLKEVNAVGHRVVHGGEKFAKSVVITDEVISAVEECNDLAPLHNPANLIGIRVCSELMPGVPQVAVFDTAFHQTMPAKAYLYGLPIGTAGAVPHLAEHQHLRSSQEALRAVPVQHPRALVRYQRYGNQTHLPSLRLPLSEE